MVIQHTKGNKVERILNVNAFQVETLDSLLAKKFPETRWLIKDLVAEASITIISADPSSFKTWLMLDMALSVSKGTQLFKVFPVEQSGILIIDEESGPKMLSERFKSLGAETNLPISYLSRTGRKLDRKYANEIADYCLSNGIGLVLFDSLVRFHSGDENTSKDMSVVFENFKNITDKGISVLILHHNRKSVAGSYNPSGDMRGSSDILASVDCHIALSRKNGGQFLEVRQTKNRHRSEINAFKLRFESDEDGSRFTFVGNNKSKIEQFIESKEYVFNLVCEHPGLTKKGLQEKLSDSNNYLGMHLLGDLIEELVSDSKVVRKPGLRRAVHYFPSEVQGSASKTQ